MGGMKRSSRWWGWTVRAVVEEAVHRVVVADLMTVSLLKSKAARTPGIWN